MSTKPVLKKAANILRAPVNEETEIDILPTGEIYMSHVHVRRRLNDAFGPMGWAIRPLTELKPDPSTNTLYREFALMANGRVVATAFGSAKYHPRNTRMDFADAGEAVKSNALTRCCKDLGIGSECWDRRFAEAWRNKYAVHVWALVKDRDNPDQKKRDNFWRRIDQKPFYGEIDICEDSPNQAGWRKQRAAWLAVVESDKQAAKELKDKARTIVRGEDPPSNGGESARQPNQAQPQAPAPPQQSEARTETPQQENSHSTRPEDRKHLIRNCRVLEKSKEGAVPKYTLYGITMKDGNDFTTFSSTKYLELQKIMAAGQRIEIDWELKKSGSGANERKFRSIIGWKVLS